jgi:hypothetical protein
LGPWLLSSQPWSPTHKWTIPPQTSRGWQTTCTYQCKKVDKWITTSLVYGEKLWETVLFWITSVHLFTSKVRCGPKNRSCMYFRWTMSSPWLTWFWNRKYGSQTCYHIPFWILLVLTWNCSSRCIGWHRLPQSHRRQQPSVFPLENATSICWYLLIARFINSVSRYADRASMWRRVSPVNSVYFGWVLIIQLLHKISYDPNDRDQQKH